MLSEYTTYEKEFTYNDVEQQQLQQTVKNECIVHFEMELYTGKIIPFTCNKTNTMAGLYRQAQRALSPPQLEMHSLLPLHDYIPPPNGSSIREIFITPENTADVLRFPKAFMTVEQFMQEHKKFFDYSLRTNQTDPLKPFAYRIYVIDEDYVVKHRASIEPKQKRSQPKQSILSGCNGWM